MTTQQAEKLITEAGLSVEEFWKFMEGKTLGLNEDGSTIVYDEDVRRFTSLDLNFIWD